MLTSNLLRSNRDISRRLSLLERLPRDSIRPKSFLTSRSRSSSTSRSRVRRFEFEGDLEGSRAYRKAVRSTVDFSFRSSIALSHAWSALSEYSLCHVSVISVVALPISSRELANGHHYRLSEHQDETGLATIFDTWKAPLSNLEAYKVVLVGGMHVSKSSLAIQVSAHLPVVIACRTTNARGYPDSSLMITLSNIMIELRSITVVEVASSTIA